jgi:hypothetical protein
MMVYAMTMQKDRGSEFKTVATRAKSKLVIGQFDTDKEAFAVESILIH